MRDEGRDPDPRLPGQGREGTGPEAGPEGQGGGRRPWPEADDVESRLDREVRFHLERKAEALRARGMSDDEAWAEALRRFGDVDEVKAEMRKMTMRREAKMRSVRWWDVLRSDLRFGARQLLGNRVFTAVAVLTLALGIGANSAIFSVVDSILFRPLPYPSPDELVTVWSDVRERGGPADEWLSWANFLDLRDQSETLEDVAAWGGWAPVMTGRGEARQLLGAVVARGMFSRVLEVEPALGRGFETPEHDSGAPGVVLLADGFWRDAFGGDPEAVGSTLELNDQTFTVVGVMPPGFRTPFVPDADVWAPARIDPLSVQNRRGGFSWRAVGRLASGASVEAAQAELAELGERLEARYPDSNTGMSFRPLPLRADLVAEARTGLLVLLGAVGLVLLVACVNVASLLMTRASSRRSELAVRSALGAGRGRIVGQLLAESGLLAAVGGAAGVALAYGGTGLLVSLAPPGTPRIDEVALDGRILAFTAAVTLLAGVLFGLAPALRAARADLHEHLREGGRGQGGALGGIRLRNGLVAGQVAFALVLLVGAGLLVRSFRNLSTEDLGFRPDGVLTMQVNLPGSRYPDADTRIDVYARLEAALGALPGVESVGLTSTVPLTGFDGDVTFYVEGRPLPDSGEEDATWFRRVSPGYFETMGIRIVAGRSFTDGDDRDAPPVLVVNQTLAERYFPDENPVGRRINLGRPDDPEWREIVGVAEDVKNFGIREGSRNATYSPYPQTTAGYVWPVLRTTLPEEVVLPAVRRAVSEIDPSLAVARFRPMSEIVRDTLAADRFVAMLLSLFGVLALVLAVVGLYGVVSHGVTTRLRELGVRMALGAGGPSIGLLVAGRSLLLVAAGLAVGVAGSLALTRLMRGLLFGVTPADPVTFVLVAVLLGGCAVVASLVPALRATRVDPVEVLRAE